MKRHITLLRTAAWLMMIAGVVLARRDAMAGQIYWVDKDTGKIQRANTDGTGVIDVVTGLTFQGGSTPAPVLLDSTGRRMYWSEPTLATVHTLFSADLDGGNMGEIAIQYVGASAALALNTAEGKIYYAEISEEAIHRANLDGTDHEMLLLQDAPRGLALDVAADKMYWSDIGEYVIMRANLDGSGIETLAIAPPVNDEPWSVAIDEVSEKLYWTTRTREEIPIIQRANLDGSEVEVLLKNIDDDFAPRGLALDVDGGKMYWTDPILGAIYRANLDGTQIEPVVTGLINPSGIAYTSIPEPSGAALVLACCFVVCVTRRRFACRAKRSAATGAEWQSVSRRVEVLRDLPAS